METKTKEFYKSKYPSEHELINQIQNWDYALQHYEKTCFSAFLMPNQQLMITELLPLVPVVFDGKINQAELKIACIGDIEEFPITLLKTTFHQKYVTITHRDVLGALMNIGLERDQFGEIYIKEDCIYVVVMTSISSYVIQSVHQIGRGKVNFEVSEETVTLEKNWSEQSYVVTSMRLDQIVSSVTNLSREKAKRLIQAGLVKLNYVTIEDVSKVCHNDSDISIRGYGRFHLLEEKAQTKKGNAVVIIAKYK